jgi:hypothetical protein
MLELSSSLANFSSLSMFSASSVVVSTFLSISMKVAEYMPEPTLEPAPVLMAQVTFFWGGAALSRDLSACLLTPLNSFPDTEGPGREFFRDRLLLVTILFVRGGGGKA